MAFGLCHRKVKRNKEMSNWADFAQEVAWCWLKPWMVCAVGRAGALSLLPVCGSSTKHSVGKDNEENPSTPVMLSQVPFKIRISSNKVASFCGLGESSRVRLILETQQLTWRKAVSVYSDGEIIEIKKQPLQPNSICLPHLCSSSLSPCLIKAHEWPRDPI